MKGQKPKFFVVTVAFLLVFGACAAPPPPPPTATPVPPTPAPLDVVQKYQDAIGRHDVDTAMALFTDDASYAWGDYFTTSDKTMIRNWLEYVAALNLQTKANDCKMSDSTVTCEWRNVHDCFGAEGAIGAGYDMGGTVVFTVKDGKISEYVLTANPDPEYNQWEEAFFKWLEDSYPMDIGSVVQALHTWKFDRAFGERLVKFCKEQAASLKSAAGATPMPSTSAPSSDLEKLAKDYRDAFNRHDADGALALFIDQGFSYFDVEFTAHDQETLRDKLEYDFGLGATLEFPDCGPKGEALRCAELWRNEYCLKAMCGFDVWHNEVTFKPKDGKIQFMSLTASPEDEKACGEAYPKYVAWAPANRPEEWKKLNAPAAYDLKGRQLGELASQVCKAYLDSQKPTSAAMPAAAADPLPIIKAYYAALNRGDVDATLALFTDDVKFRGEYYATGKEMLRGVFDWLAGSEVKHGPPDCQLEADRVACTFTIADACVVASGATDGLPANSTYLIQPDGKIREASESLGDTGWDDYNEWFHSFQNWAVLNRAEEWRGSSQSKEFAPRYVKLCREYAESLK